MLVQRLRIWTITIYGTVFRQHPQLQAQISDLQGKLDNFVSAQPPDWSKVDFTQQLTEAVAKAPQLQSPAPSQVNSRQQVKQANEEHLCSYNLIIYNVSHDKTKPIMALTYAQDYLCSGLLSTNAVLPE